MFLTSSRRIGSSGRDGSMTEVNPRVFISYAWSSEAHRTRVREWAERLRGDGIDVVLDVWDLKEGDDTTVLMERAVTVPNISHVLIVCDTDYSQKADAREAGVGTETQLISKKVYESVLQSKFIPILCVFDDIGKPVMPAYLANRY